MSVMKDRSSCNGKLIAAIDALIQIAFLTSLSVGGEIHHPFRFAPDARQTFRKANLFKVFNALFFGIELREMLEYRWLRMWFLFNVFHDKRIMT